MTARRSRAVSSAAPVVLLLLPAAASWAAKGEPGLAILAGKIVTVTNGTVDHGVILIRDGRIEAVGPAAGTPVPADYQVVDVSGKWVLPGMVEIHSHCGLRGWWGINDMVCQLNPGLRIGDGVDPESVIAQAALAAGVTTIQTVPGSGTNHGGFGVAFKTAGATKEERLIRRVSVMKMTQAYNPERTSGDIGASRMGMTWLLREHLTAAKEYDARWSAYERGETDQPPPRDLALEFARPVFHGDLPVLIHTYESWGVATTLRMFHDEFGLKATATHVEGGGYQVAQAAAERDLSVNVGPFGVDFSAEGDGRFRGVAAQYYGAGVKRVSLNTDALGLGQAYLALAATLAARLGCDERAALEMVTINPARAILLDDRVGSIEVGKDADLVVKASSLLDPNTPVEMVFVNGQLAYRRDAGH